ncbi:MAG: hypothetical protein A2W27_10985 [Deltaproteobacteria bacterium RBG_16_44_11]|nr:MAG: hypothetical protein A2W27_10985 [Deltaproteobacteria bacterium RBG_16_44_11]
MSSPPIVRKPEKVVEIDETVTHIIMKKTVHTVKIKDEASAKYYRITRTPIKKGLQMTGA